METRVIHVRVDVELHEALKQKAAGEDRTVSYIAARLLRQSVSVPEQFSNILIDALAPTAPDGEQP